MQGILYEEPSVWLFLLVTVIAGGSAAWQTGKAVASTWKPPLQLFFYMLILGFAVRFIHFSMFEGTLLSLKYYVADTIILLLFAYAGWRVQRARQMAEQYAWCYESGGFGVWKRKN